MIENEFPSGRKYVILASEEGTARGERNFCQGHFSCMQEMYRKKH